jgi:chemotaxis protein MotB
MNKTIYYFAFLLLITGLLFSSCVSSRKFKSSEARISILQNDSALTADLLDDCNVNRKKLEAEKESLTSKNNLLTDENTAALLDLQTLSVKSNTTIAEQAERLKNLKDIIQSQRDVMNKLKNSISEALINYGDDELTVYVKDGNVYVSLQEKLLFKSGSDVVDPKGKEALKKLVQVLATTKDINVIIEGHTDNIPIKTAQFKDNWALSTSRSNSILRIMTTEYGFNSEQISSSGKGQFHPVQTNKTEAGRAGNRRTEIILSPDLKEIYTLLYL